jgi:hypothetical protein
VLALLRFVLRSTSATNLRVTGTSRLRPGARRKIGPAIASSSGRFPRSTSFCMELRMLPGKFLIVEITESGSTFAPSASATAQAWLNCHWATNSEPNLVGSLLQRSTARPPLERL